MYQLPPQSAVRLRSSKAADKDRAGHLLYQVAVPYGRDYPTLYAVYLPARTYRTQPQPAEVRYLRSTQLEATERPTRWLLAACCDKQTFPVQDTPDHPYPELQAK